MNPAALRLALRLRHEAVEAAQQHLAECIEAEMRAAAAARQANAAIQIEAEAASAIGSDDAAVEAFAAWLPRGRTAQAAAAARHAACLDATSIARASVGVARAAEEAVGNALEAHAAQLRAGIAKRAQETLEEAGQASRRGWKGFLRR